MYSTEFTVDMSVWRDGVTFQTELASLPAREFALPETQNAFAHLLTEEKRENFAAEQKKSENDRPSAPAAPIKRTIDPETAVNVAAAEQSTDDGMVDITALVVGADSKPGARLNDQIARTEFVKSGKALIDGSPYNMSEAKAKAREAVRNPRPLQGVGDAKVFPMNTAARFHDAQTKYGVNQPLTAADAAKRLKTQEMRQQATAAREKQAGFTPVDVSAIKTQVSDGGFGYRRDVLPSGSNEKTTPAAAWFPEAMTRQLDAYEAARKVAAARQSEVNVTL